jgi:carbon-monoxide dehydrogenase medium subunit
MAFALGIPRVLKYIRVSSIDEALELLRFGNAKPIAGGQSLLPFLKLRISSIDYLIDINDLEFKFIKREDNYVRIGALLTHNEIINSLPLLRKAALNIADIQVRNRGTIGGSISHADPSTNYYPPLLVLNAILILRSKSGERMVSIKEFYKEPYTTQMRNDEILTEILIPKEENFFFNFEVFKRGGSAFPTAIVSLKFNLSNSVIVNFKISIGGVFERPVLVENYLDGKDYNEVKANPTKFAEEILKNINERVLEDVHGSREYRIKLARNLLAKAIFEVEKVDGVKVHENVNKLNGRILVRAEEPLKARIKVNGREVEDFIEPRTLLIDFLRKNGFREVKRGCDEGKCGACSVIFDGKSVKSCLLLAVQAIGHEINTVKGLKNIEPIQRAFVENYAMQCGYCTHGFLIAVYDYLYNVDYEVNEEILKYYIKNICRCTGYFNIIRAIKKASEYIKNKV